MNRLAAVLRMIRFEHSVFALPFALSGAWIAARGLPPWSDLAGIVVAAVAARSAAMAFNRIADRRLDGRNPRTSGRELVTGALSVRWTAGFTLCSAALFVAASFWLAPLCGWLSLPVLAVLLGYSYLKRFTVLSHFGLGLALGCAPAGAWLAVSKEFTDGWEVPAALGLAVLFWVAGFDLLYSLQDEEHDRRSGLFSLPAAWGAARARAAAVACHLVALLLLTGIGLRGGLDGFYFAGVAVVSFLLFLQHWLVRGGSLERLPTAFFTVNAWVGVAYFVGLAAELHAATGGATLGR